MAPKGTKRASTGGIERAAKKAIASKCAVVAAELEKVDSLPQRCRAMLASIAGPALATYATERHEFQVQCVDMVAKALAMVETELESSVSQEQVKVGSSNAEQAARVATRSSAEVKLVELQQAASIAKETLEADILAEQAAKIKLSKAQEVLKEKESELASDVEKKKSLDDTKMAYEPLKTAKLSGQEGRKTLNALTKVLKELEFEDLAVTTIAEAVYKEVHERGTFDHIVMEQVDKTLSESIAAVDASITSGDSVKAELAAAQMAAEQHHATLVEKLAASRTGVQAANTAVSDGKITLKEAGIAIKNFEKDMTVARKKLEEGKVALESFRVGALKAFTELQELAPVLIPALEEPVPDKENTPIAQDTVNFKNLD